jgi:hypothetical protein
MVFTAGSFPAPSASSLASHTSSFTVYFNDDILPVGSRKTLANSTSDWEGRTAVVLRATTGIRGALALGWSEAGARWDVRRDRELVAAIFLPSDAASFAAGQMLVVDGGFLASGATR